ncbi:Pleckstrin homology domain-domain-containing protein [Protomyces lactucae-debilis]|uniref:Pleckstrin homology domain-domain-containing protein n=1 Tax=Protomyces lactucae-debilis TaxID=2754530 RepID=A0A1Y2FQQ2_PROLT|nr:Pleckstrin homology domain-containing protein [Protomyces lactucae-debilis]ORY86269.1 Pleckstrin homology domain-domain-containing protein [Protomyces lactucae-debilis]
MKHSSDSNRPQPLRRQNSHLVHFSSNQIVPERSSYDITAAHPSRRICSEGRELAAATQKARSSHEQGFLNQKYLKNPFRRNRHEGELLRAERMLLRIEYAKANTVPSSYSDVHAGKLERRTSMHWREFVLAARPNAEGHVVLYFHRNRTIPAIAKNITNIKATKEIVLDPKYTSANLYSTLDKTIVIWTTDPKKKRDWIFILRPRTLQTSVEWYAFIQTLLGVKRRSYALMTVPTLGVKLKLELPSSAGKSTDDAHSLASDDGSEADLQMNDEGAVVDGEGKPITGNYLIDKCLTMLATEPCWQPVVQEWRRSNLVGLCWRRYDRIEWLHGPGAQRSIGQWAMAETHELELRPKEHYPTSVTATRKLPAMDEPAPIEGFLVRLTSSTGRQSRFGKVFYKRLYFSTHDGLLFYAFPMNATPPPPPSFVPGVSEAEAEELVKASPLVYTVEPYPLEDGKITWTRHCDREVFAKQDKMAMTEAARRVKQLHASTGYLDLTKVVKIRSYKQTKQDVDHDLDHGDGVDFDGEEDETMDTGVTDEVDDARIFEIVLDSGLVVRLQAFNLETRNAWIRQLRQLVVYWKRRLAEDESALAAMRRENMETLRIDEQLEPLVDMVCNRWEVAHCVSEPKRYNFCSITSCRTIAIQGLLYRKPRVHSTFKRYNCVVSHGKLFVYNHFHYKASGDIEHHIHNSKRQEIDLSDCYIFSGMITQGDLLDSREDFDRLGPGRHSLPRLYADGWTSQDDQEALCFVLWSGRRRVALSQLDKKDSGRKKSVSRLGVAGHSMVYLCRCRQERDLWVQIISREIERTTQESLSSM